MRRAALYVRVSTAEQTEGHSIDAQLDYLRSEAAKRSYTINHEFIDPGFQGDTDNRPGLNAMMTAARSRRFDVVLVYRFDRLFREVRLFLNYEHELRLCDVKIISITEAIDDTHEGRLQLLIKGSFAEYEKAVIRERANQGKIRAAREGKWVVGVPPYGYDLDPETSKLVINQVEAERLRQFFHWLVEDELNLAQLQKRVNDLHIPTKFGSTRSRHSVNRTTWWMKRTLGRLLTRSLYATGVYQYRRVCKPRAVRYRDATERSEDDWIAISVPPIIDQRLFDLGQQQLKRNTELAWRRTHRLYMLRRLLWCGSCNRSWVARTNRTGCASYVCSGKAKTLTSTPCARASVAASRIEPVVWSTLERLLCDPTAVIEEARSLLTTHALEQGQSSLNDTLIQLDSAKAEDARLLHAYKEGVIDLDTLRREREETAHRVARLAQLRDELATRIEGWTFDTDAVSERISRLFARRLQLLTYGKRCEVVGQLVEKVIVRNNTSIEIHTILPDENGDPSSRLPVGQTRSGKSRNVSADSLLRYAPAIGKVIRLTLVADLLPSRPGPRARRQLAA